MTTLPRRSFLGTTLATAAYVTASSHAVEDGAASPPLKIGLIGCGWWGLIDARAALKAGGCEVVALCDIDADHLAKAADEIAGLQGKRPATFKEYGDLLAVDGLQAVILATPPQWHALPFIAACQRGLDIYCEKPLAYDVREGRAMVDAAKKAGNVVQIGFQRRRAGGFAGAREYLQAGHAGRIISVEAQINVPIQHEDRTPVEPPSSLDWDRWCGPAPLLPYSKAVGHFHWRLEKTTGHGHLADWGIHLIDAARWILNAGSPRQVTSSGGLYHLKDRITTPDVLTSHFEFADFPLTWHHRIWGTPDFHRETANGIFFYGEKETVFCTDDRWVVQPQGKGEKEQVHEARGDASGLHMSDFLAAVRERKAVICPIDDAHLSTTAVQLAMISLESGSRIIWNADSEEIVGNPEAASLLKREYRAPWVHPGRA